MEEWHYPRTDIAEQYLGLLKLGISSSYAIIAPRRKGKTLFVLQDLAPLSEKQGYFPVYASLWQNINAPHEGLIAALEESIAALDEKSPWSSLMKSKVRKTAISNEMLGRFEVEFADHPGNPSSQDMARLDQLLRTLEKKVGDRTVLLLIDEVQHLATDPAFSPLAHTLRTLLDKRQGSVKSVFTGSSRHYMDLLLNDQDSPFFHFAEIVPFPDLDEGFIRFLRDRLLQVHKITVPLRPLLKAFDELDRSPYWMMKLISRMVTYQVSVDEGLITVMEMLDTAEGFEDIANKLRPIDRLMFIVLSQGGNPYSHEVMEQVTRETTVKGVASNIQRSILRLKKLGLVSQLDRSRYQIEKPGLKRYLAEN